MGGATRFHYRVVSLTLENRVNVDQILALDRELTEEECLFLEQETLKAVRQLSQHVDDLLPQIAEKDPALADRLEVSSNTMLLATEAAAAIPLDGRQDLDVLRELAESRAVRAPNRRTRRRR